MAIQVSDIIEVLRSKRFILDHEKKLQSQIFEVLRKAFPDSNIAREYNLDGRNIIDFYVEQSIGIEVKIKGAKRNLYNQCVRYCAFAEIKSFLLVTSLQMGFPAQINHKDCYVHQLNRAWL